jgi:hypothetical protein
MQFKIKLYNKLVSPNVKRHWANIYVAGKKMANEFRMRALDKKIPRSIPSKAKVTITRIGQGVGMDLDNINGAAKTLRDAIADWLIPGLKAGYADGSKNIEWEYSQRKPIDNEEFKIEVEILFYDAC